MNDLCGVVPFAFALMNVKVIFPGASSYDFTLRDKLAKHQLVAWGNGNGNISPEDLLIWKKCEKKIGKVCKQKRLDLTQAQTRLVSIYLSTPEETLPWPRLLPYCSRTHR